MKKVLFATTALVATAGVASAEVVFGGYGRVGMLYQENAAGTDETRIEQRFRLTITGQTESDNGVKFEGRIRFQTDDGVNNQVSPAANSAAGFAVSTGGFRLDVGHVSDVLDGGDVGSYYGYGAGLTSSLEQSSAMGLNIGGFGTSVLPVDTKVKALYSVGGFSGAVSYTDGQTPADKNTQIGAGYKFGAYNVGLVYGDYDLDANDFVAVMVGGTFGDFAVNALFVDNDLISGTGVGLSAQYSLSSATALRAVYSKGKDPKDTYGIGFSQNLGGGVSMLGSVGSKNDSDFADLGVVFNF